MNDPLEVLSSAVRTERDALARLARAEGLGPEDAVDCVQDAFCTYFRMAMKGETAQDVSALLAGIVRNHARNARRKHHRARPHDEIDALDATSDADARTGLTARLADELVAEAEEHVRLRACVDRLCDTQKAVVTLRMLEERPGEDVASSLGITRAHVDVLLHRAKSSLRACMLHGP